MGVELSDGTVTRLRTLVAAIGDSVHEIDTLLGSGAAATPLGSALATAGGAGASEILSQEPFGEFVYRWPTGAVEYMDTVRYTVRRNDADYVFAVGAEPGGRPSYQRVDRGRIVVFIRSSRTSETSYYPLVEFAQSDLDPDVYAAVVPRPASPRKGASTSDLDELRRVPHLENAQLERADKVFRSLRNAPTLRLLAHRDDPKLMIEHAWWVGGLRGTSAT